MKGHRWHFGAALLIGLGLDCADAPRSAVVPPDEPAPASASLPAADAIPPATAVAPTEEPEPTPPGTRYALLTHDGCRGELAARGIAHEALAPRLGIRSPVRLRGKLSGVSFRTLWPDEERTRTSFEIIDCRLVLAMDDFAKLLRARGIVDVMFFSAYRPPPAGWTPHASSSNPHEAGLAIDIGYFRKANGLGLNIERDFMPRPNERERICVPAPPAKDATHSGIELRSIACEAASSHLFHLTLTPAYDTVHRDHFHLEVAPDKTDFVAR